ncbi:PREDICTED: F-box/LRR-repeat, partial [Prunus dulcis]
LRCYYKNKRTTSIMEPKRKLLATTSSQAQGACPDHMKDRFSDLPNEVAHQILSSVSILDLTRFGTLSKKCRELYLSTPSLNFDEFNNWNKSSYAKQFKLLSSLDRFLVRRRENKIHCFRICWSLSHGKAASLYNELYRVVTWIRMAVRCNVEVLDLELRIPDTTMLELPSCIFLCGSLRSLSVHCNKILTAPSLDSSTNLQYLKLTNVTIDEGFCKWISCSCKCIKELHLEHVEVENITMESLSLESFSFVFPSYCGLCHLNISCEKLEDIHIEWRFASTSSRSFKKAEIFLKHGVDNNDFSNVLEVLCSVCRAKVLILSGEMTKALLREGPVSTPCGDISYLGMHIESLDNICSL